MIQQRLCLKPTNIRHRYEQDDTRGNGCEICKCVFYILILFYDEPNYSVDVCGQSVVFKSHSKEPENLEENPDPNEEQR